MERLKYFVFIPRKVKCFECKDEGTSKLYTKHWIGLFAMTLFALVLTWLTGYLPGVTWRPITLAAYFGTAYTPYMLAVWWLVVLSMIFTPKGHRCAACGSPWIKAI
ncbi:MAG: hypothetical protein JST80_05425 [Bdellovibrionales bacterium]|nr:hypothetical protein [Bdellovibrionales bacterium]